MQARRTVRRRLSIPILRLFRERSRAARFCLLAILFLAAFGVLFEVARPLFATLYLWPVSRVAVFFLGVAGLDARLDATGLDQGICELVLADVIYVVNFDCAGTFALVAFVALVAAYPVPWSTKGNGLLLGIPAIASFSVLRLVVLGVVARLNPDWIELFHVYVMELATLGFMLFVWKVWVDDAVHDG